MDKKSFLHFITTSFLLFALLGCAGSRTKIADIQNNPSKYNEKRVKVAGKVTQTFAIPVLGQSLVRVDDGTGTIWVKPKGRVPFEGDKIKVEGTLKVALTIGTKNFGFIVIEDDKK
jgi:hypothetical protein